jgi:FKBP-type peptidyl-prolyl cis-trans isomerase FkpA
MRKVKMLLFALAVISMASACKKGSTGTTAGGYAYTIHTKGSGNKPNTGDYVMADMYVRKDTQLLYASSMRGASERFVVEEVKDVKDPVAKMILEAVKMLGKGDSATFVLKIDSTKAPINGFQGAKEARVTFAVKEVLSETQFVATLKPEEKTMFMQMKEFRVRAKSVADSTTAFAKDYAAGKLPAGVQTTASGLKYKILKQGTGALPKKGQGVAVHYYGALKDGVSFDQSFERGQPITFPIGQGQVIPGWDEGIMLLPEGSVAVLFIPAAQAYGDKSDPGSPIPANSDLIFYVDLMKVFDAPKNPQGMPQGMPQGQ